MVENTANVPSDQSPDEYSGDEHELQVHRTDYHKRQRQVFEGPSSATAASPPLDDRAMRRRGHQQPTTTPSASAASPAKKDRVNQQLPPQANDVPAFHAIEYLLEVLLVAAAWLKRPLSALLVVVVIAFMLSTFMKAAGAVLSPICMLPGISYIVPICAHDHSRSPIKTPDGKEIRRPAFDELMTIQTRSLSPVLESVLGGSSMSLEVTKARVAVNDLIAAVELSDLPSRDELARNLRQFTHDARKASHGLQRLNAQLGGSVDSILSVNEHAMRTIAAAEAMNEHTIWGFVLPKALQPAGPSQEKVTYTFMQSFSVLSSNLGRLIVAADASQSDLMQLEEQLDVIYKIVVRDDESVRVSRDELLATLWSKLGGNMKEKQKFADNLRLLRGLSRYREDARTHVLNAFHSLQTLSADMDELQIRVSKPELSGHDVPLRTHLESIRKAVERLSQGRLTAKEIEERERRRILNS